MPFLDQVRDRLGFVPGERAFRGCTRCGAGQLQPWPQVDELPGFYPPVYSFAGEFQQASAWKQWLARLEFWGFYGRIYRGQAQIVKQATGGSPTGKQLLDLGCGRGLRLLAFRELGYAVHGLDFQPEVVRVLSEKHDIPAVAASADAAAEHFPPASFDVITAFYLLEHVPDVAAVLAAAHALLKPGGWFVAAVPLVDSVQAGWFGTRWIHVGEAPRHLSLPTQAALTIACQRAGFQHIRIRSDSLFECAGGFAGSAVSGASITHAYASNAALGMLKRIGGGLVMLGAIPWCYLEATVYQRPGQGLVIGQKA